MTIKPFLCSATAITLCALAWGAKAETVHTKTYVTPQTIEGATRINFSAFDVNRDGKYSMSEVGEKLFYVFDQDGNEVIDNIEWDSRNMYTIIPMEKQTFQYVDTDNDGVTDVSVYSYDQFYETSGLIRFDEDKDGLSASEFIGVGFQTLDKDDNNLIEKDEWKKAYIASRKPANAEQERYND